MMWIPGGAILFLGMIALMIWQDKRESEKARLEQWEKDRAWEKANPDWESKEDYKARMRIESDKRILKIRRDREIAGIISALIEKKRNK